MCQYRNTARTVILKNLLIFVDSDVESVRKPINFVFHLNTFDLYV